MLERLLARWPLKLLALGLAFAMWLTVTAEKRIPRDFRVPVDVPRVAADLVRTTLSDSTVSVRIRGPESLVNTILATDLTLRIDPADLGPGVQEIRVADYLRGVPVNAEVDWIDPPVVTITFDRRLRRSLPVVPSFVGEPAEGYHLYGYTALPERVEVDGSEAQVAPLENVRTDPISLSGRDAPFSVRVGLQREGTAVEVISTNRRPEIRVDIAEAPLRADFAEVTVIPGAQVLDLTFEPAAVEVKLSAPPEILARIRSEQLRAVADVSRLESGLARPLPLTIDIRDLPAPDRARVKVESIKPKTVRARSPQRSSR